jgi:glycosyltransferase involved in cell wall biosynthesis
VKLSIIIPAFNEEKLLGRCLACVATASAALADRGWEHEVIVCDNNSTDRTAAIAREAGAQVVFEPVNQIGRARNTGARAGTGDWLLFLDGDSFPSPGLFGELAGALADPRVLAGGAMVEMEGYAGPAVWLARLWNGLSRLARWAPGGFLFCEAEAFRELGGFNEDLFVSEEIDLSQRLKRHARTRDRRLAILRRHRLTTSARKLHLYSRQEFWTFTKRYLRHPFRAQRDRAACPIWYDGRR